MKSENILKMTSKHSSDELVMKSVKKLLQKARKKGKELDKALQDVYQVMEDMCIDLETHSNAENADTLEQAINCYVLYDEYNLDGLLMEIRQQYIE